MCVRKVAKIVDLVGKGSKFAIWISLISNAILTLLKLTVGILFRSQVLIADGVHNAGDVFGSLVTFIAMKISKKPADEDHPYGHGRAEVLSAGIVAFILATAALFIIYESIAALSAPPGKASIFALGIALMSLTWKQFLYLYTIRIGRKNNSKGLIATAYDHLADIYASIAAVIGIGLALLGNIYGVNYFEYCDPIAGLVVSIFILKLVYTMAMETVDILMEKNVDQEKLDRFGEIILSIAEVKGIDRLTSREHGHYMLVDTEVSISGILSVQEGHDVCLKIKQSIMDKYPDVDEVLVHVNPWYET